MKSDRVNKSYEGLEMHERIALAFHHSANDNELEVLRLRDTIPRDQPGRPIQALSNGLQRWHAITAFYGINHYRLRTMVLEARLAALMALTPERTASHPDAFGQLADAAAAYERKLIALDRALVTVCTENGIDPEDIRRLNDVEPHLSLVPNLEPDAAFEQQMLKAVRQAL